MPVEMPLAPVAIAFAVLKRVLRRVRVCEFESIYPAGASRTARESQLDAPGLSHRTARARDPPGASVTYGSAGCFRARPIRRLSSRVASFVLSRDRVCGRKG